MSNKKYDSTTSKIFNPYHPFELEWGSWTRYESVIKEIREVFEKKSRNRFIVLQGVTGSGKTSILKQIENSPDLLGENHIPIYLDSRKYIGIHMDNLPRVLYKDVIERLNKHGYNIPMFDAIGPTEDDTTIDFIFLKIDTYCKPDDILVLIFDEFDQLLKNADVKGISDFIQYIKNIKRSWSNYGLIIVGEEILEQSNDSSIIHRFLTSGIEINLDKFLKEEDTVKRIVEPGKNILKYEKEAIKKITWYSGKNLYFEQLICYFIVYHLDEKNRNNCTPEDVDTVVQRILTDQKDEFNKAWEKELPAEMKLIASALADERLTERRSHIYILAENKLLDAIFGEKLNEKIVELQQMGYINRIHGKHFPKFPFKIPIYGLFIQKYHHFIKTLVENIEFTADKIGLNLLVEEIVNKSVHQLDLFDKEAISQLAGTWTLLKAIPLEKKRTPTRPQIQPFLDNFTNLLKLNAPLWDSNKKHFILDIKNLNIGILAEVHCLIQGRPKLLQDDIDHIENAAIEITQGAKTRLALYFYFQESDLIEKLVKKSLLTLIAFSENDLKKIMLSNRPMESFKKIILGRLSLQLLNPYHTEGPAIETFYGRGDIINRINRNANSSYSIVGARKIGKTSLLYKIKNDLPSNFSYLFTSLELEFHEVKSYGPFLKNLESEIEWILYKRIKFNRFPFRKDMSKLPEVFRKLSKTHEKKIVLIFDEIDGLIEFDRKNKFKLIKTFRILSQKNYCQFIFAGFKELHNIKRHHENPMYNFCEEIIMDPLDNEAALELVTKPMGNIGVYYHDEQDRMVILEYTGRHPNLLQFFCKKLIEKVEKHSRIEDRRTIFEGDIEEVFDKEYQKYIIDDVYMFFSDLSDINRLILILLVEASLKKRYFSIAEIKGSLMDYDISITINDLHRNLRELMVRFILLEEGENYRFALPIFPEILKKRVGNDNKFKEKTIKEIKTKGDKNQWKINRIISSWVPWIRQTIDRYAMIVKRMSKKSFKE